MVKFEHSAKSHNTVDLSSAQSLNGQRPKSCSERRTLRCTGWASSMDKQQVVPGYYNLETEDKSLIKDTDASAECGKVPL